jgi:arginine/serine-rich splicing factor 2
MAVSSGFVCWLARRTGDSRGFAFVRYKYADEAQKAIDRLDGGVCFFFLFCFNRVPPVGILGFYFY